MRDIVAHPFERQHAVEHAGVARVRVFFADLAEIEVAKDVEPVINADDDDILLAREIRAVVGRRAVGAAGVTPAVQPDHHGPPAVIRAGRPDVEDQTVFADFAGAEQVPHGLADIGAAAGARENLRRDIAVGQGVGGFAPRLRRSGRHETHGAFWVCAVVNAFEGGDAAGIDAEHFAVFSRDNGSSGIRGEQCAGERRAESGGGAGADKRFLE